MLRLWPLGAVACVFSVTGCVSPEAAQDGALVAAKKPPAPVIEQPADGSTSHETRPVFVGTATPLSTVELVLDDTVVMRTGADATGAWAVTAGALLTGGQHVVRATAQGTDGVPSARATSTFSVDLSVPPRPVIALPLSASVNTTKVLVTGEAEASSTVQLTVDGAATSPVVASEGGAWAKNTTLTAGVHTLRATATNAAGQTSEPSLAHTLTIDLVAPAAPIIESPADGLFTSQPQLSLGGRAEPGTLIQLVVDGVQLRDTTGTSGDGGWRFDPREAWAEGAHVAQAQAVDQATNASPLSAKLRFTVDTTPPQTMVTSSPSGTTNETTATFVFRASEAGSTFTCALDGRPATACSSPLVVRLLEQGAHTFTVRATDVAGNEDPAPASKTWTVAGYPHAVEIAADGGLRRDGAPWVPKSVHLVGFLGPRALESTAYQKARDAWGQAELDAIQAAGADTVLFALAQNFFDPQCDGRISWCKSPQGAPLYDYDGQLAAVRAAWHLARTNGLTVVLMLNSANGGGSPVETTQWPDAMTVRAVQTLCGFACGDPGTMFELYGEPNLGHDLANPNGWQALRDAYQPMVDALRDAGSTQVLWQDGRHISAVLTQADGSFVPADQLVVDPLHQLGYAVHPFPENAEQKEGYFDYLRPADWDRYFGNWCRATNPRSGRPNTCFLAQYFSGSKANCYDGVNPPPPQVSGLPAEWPHATSPLLVQSLLRYAADNRWGINWYAFDLAGRVTTSLDAFELSSFLHGPGGGGNAFGACADYGGGNYGPGEMMKAYNLTGDTSIR